MVEGVGGGKRSSRSQSRRHAGDLERTWDCAERAIAGLPGGVTVKTLARRGRTPFIAAGILLLAAGLRFYHLAFQPGLHFDEAYNGFDIQSVLQGQHPIFFPGNRGREPLFIYWQSLVVALLGLTPFTLRLASAFCGVLTVAATYFAVTQLLLCVDRPRTARWLALAAEFLLATGYWHIAFSRVGLRAVSLPFFALMTFGFLWRGLRRDRRWDFALAGLFGGLAMYTYLSSRLLPLIPTLVGLAALAVGPFRRRLGQLALCAAVWLAVFAPLGAYYLQHPDNAWGRAEEVSIFNPTHGGDQPLRALALALQRNAQMVAVETTHTLTGPFDGRSAFDPVSGVLFWLGVGVIGWRLVRRPRSGRQAASLAERWHSDDGPGATTTALAPSDHRPIGRLAYGFLVVWPAVMVLPSILSVHAPQHMRAIGALPAFAIVAALGAGQVARLGSALKAPVAGWVVAVVLLVGSATLNYRDYFVVWLPSDTAYYQLMAEKVEAARLVGEWTESHRVFLAPLYYQDHTVRFVARQRWNKVQTFDVGAAMVIPSGQPALYVFPAIDEEQPRLLQRRLGPAAKLETVSGSNGKPLLRVVRVDKPAQEKPPALATLEGSVELVSAQIEPTRAKPGGSLKVSLAWRALRRLTEDFTVFVHLRDEAGQTVAQKDGQPGGGSFPTLWWQAEDTILDECVLALPKEVAPGEYRVVVGMYRLATLKRLEMMAGGRRADGDELTLGSEQVAR